jgi:hypothetical protein
VSSQMPGMTLWAPGTTRISPAVARRSVRRSVSSRSATTMRAAPASASRRSSGGVVGLAGERHAQADHAADRLDDAQPRSARAQDRPLLDVELDVGTDLAHAVHLSDARGIESARRHRLRHADAVPVARRERFAHVRPAERAAAEQRGAEARALLVHERADPDRPRRREVLAAQGADGLHGRQHSERAVERAARRHGVQVRRRHHRRPVTGGPAAEQVAGGIDLHVEAQPLQLLAHPRRHLGQRRRPGESVDPAVRPRAEARSRGEIAGEAHARAAPTPSSAVTQAASSSASAAQIASPAPALAPAGRPRIPFGLSAFIPSASSRSIQPGSAAT